MTPGVPRSSIRKRFSNAGFTLMEMMVVTAIMALITGLVLANHGRFGGQVLLQNLAYDIALSIRQSQVYGISVVRFQGAYAPAYGMHFDISSPNEYALFGDSLTPQNGLYDCPNPGTINCELIQVTKIQSGYRIADLCATPAGGSETCGLTKLDITFQRPEPDAYIRSPNLAGINEAARIKVTSPRGDTKYIVVEVSGQIAVQ